MYHPRAHYGPVGACQQPYLGREVRFLPSFGSFLALTASHTPQPGKLLVLAVFLEPPSAQEPRALGILRHLRQFFAFPRVSFRC
jgi:hypothetical protein